VGFNNALGRFGEDVAAAHLTELGWAILDRNWRRSFGELDIVAREDDTVVFVEVKTRSSVRFGLPSEAITYEKAGRLRTLALHWLGERRVAAPLVRFDVVSVLRTEDGPQIDHLRGAF